MRGRCAASTTEEQAITLLLAVGYIERFEPCLLARSWRLCQLDDALARFGRPGFRHPSLIHLCSEMQMVEHAQRLNGIGGDNASIADLDKMIAISLFAAERQIGRAGTQQTACKIYANSMSEVVSFCSIEERLRSERKSTTRGPRRERSGGHFSGVNRPLRTSPQVRIARW